VHNAVIDNHNLTALSAAAEHGNEAVVRLLLEHGANIDEKNNEGWTALLEAAYWNYETTLQIIENGANLNTKDKYGRTALRLVANDNKERAIKILLEHRVDVDAEDEEGNTPLGLAIKKGGGNTSVQLLTTNKSIY